jgi:xylose dehydrogenase (NAD/NADP)
MIRLALVGCRSVARQYAEVRARFPDQTFAAVADEDERLARESARVLGPAVVTGSQDELLAEHADAFQAMLIHTDTRTREADAVRAAQAGKHVLVDTPMARCAESARQLIDACQKADVRLMVGQNRRFLPSVQTVKQSLASGQLGEPGLLRVHRWEAPREIPDEHRRDAILADLAGEIDLACWLFDAPPERVYAVARGQGELRDYVQLHLGFPGGGMALIDYSRKLPEGDGYFSLSMIGSSGAAYVDDHHNCQLLFRGGRPSAPITGQGSLHVEQQLREFLNAIGEDREPSITGLEGKVVVEVAAAAEQSLTEGQAVDLGGESQSSSE